MATEETSTAAPPDTTDWAVDAFDETDVRVLLDHLAPGTERPTDPADAREALRQLLAQHVADGGGAIYPLSWNQTSLWYMDQLAPSSAAYHVGAATRMAGEVDVDALRRAVQGVSDRHAAVRTRFLTLQGRPFQVVHHGQAALEVAPSFRPDVVLLDLGLPGMDGYEVARRLREIPGMDRTLLVALTGYGQEDDRHRSRSAGFDEHLVKPVQPEDLALLLRERLGGVQATETSSWRPQPTMAPTDETN